MKVTQRTKYLACVLLGVTLTLGAFGVLAAANAYHQLNQRVSRIEGYLNALDQMLRSQQ